MYHGKLIYVPCADSVLKNIVLDREFGGGGGLSPLTPANLPMLKCTSFATLWAELSFDHARRVTRVTSLKILGVKKVTNRLSISEHVRDVTSRCGQSMHALRILRCHGLPAESLQTECKAVVVAKLTYASPAWWGFTIADDIDIRSTVSCGGVREPGCAGRQYHSW